MRSLGLKLSWWSSGAQAGWHVHILKDMAFYGHTHTKNWTRNTSLQMQKSTIFTCEKKEHSLVTFLCYHDPRQNWQCTWAIAKPMLTCDWSGRCHIHWTMTDKLWTGEAVRVNYLQTGDQSAELNHEAHLRPKLRSKSSPLLLYQIS